jgi:transposase
MEEISCMAHARRHFFELYKAKKSPLAKEGVERIDVLYDIEKSIRGRSPQRRAARQEYAVPLLNEIHAWMLESLSQIDAKSDLAKHSITRSIAESSCVATRKMVSWK